MKIICIGRNYSAHARELGNEIPDRPVIFMKPDTALLKGSDFYLPEFSSDVHYELEVVLKISRGGKYIQKEHAHKYFDDISVGIDFTARDLQADLKAKGLPWELAKAFDGSAVVGKFLPKTNLTVNNISFNLNKNNKTVQQGDTSQMMFGYDDIIAFVSQYFTLRTGDLIFTGTPEGVGSVREGDRLEAFLEGEKMLDLRIM